jgi:hypothetical protein
MSAPMADSNIREVQFGKPQQNEDVIRTLEEWLERARSGEICAVAIAGVKRGGSVSTEWKGASGGWYHHLVSAASVLQHRIVASRIDE